MKAGPVARSVMDAITNNRANDTLLQRVEFLSGFRVMYAGFTDDNDPTGERRERAFAACTAAHRADMAAPRPLAAWRAARQADGFGRRDTHLTPAGQLAQAAPTPPTFAAVVALTAPAHLFRWALDRDGKAGNTLVAGPMGYYVATISGASEDFRAHLLASINAPQPVATQAAPDMLTALEKAEVILTADRADRARRNPGEFTDTIGKSVLELVRATIAAAQAVKS